MTAIALNPLRRCRHALLGAAVALVAGCAGVPPSEKTAPPGATLSRQYARADLGDGIVLNYEIVRQLSSVRASACYGFITGTLVNNSPRTLSRRSVVDVIVSSGGSYLFRDLTNPVADIPPQASAAIGLVSSPVHQGTCPDYDGVKVNLRRVDVAQ
ncbi:MAG TPA: hypothetical protein VFY24_12615 [Azospira sp.]|nr:hypothetical protein [Azospira sp.]